MLGMGRMLEEQQIYDATTSSLQSKLLAGGHVLITAGRESG
jgi:phosphopantothenoylcysteine synthetase/decarboxylase